MNDAILRELIDDKRKCYNMINSVIVKLETYSAKLKLRDDSERELAGLEMTINFLMNAKECLK